VNNPSSLNRFRGGRAATARGGGRLLELSLAGLLVIGLSLSVNAGGAAAAPIIRAPVPALPGATVAVIKNDALIKNDPRPALVVTSLRTGGEAALHGVRVGDRILALNGKPVRSRRELRRVLAATGSPILRLRLRRGTHALAVALRR